MTPHRNVEFDAFLVKGLLAVVLSLTQPTAAAEAVIELFDVHSHFTQADAGALDAEQILRLLDRNGIDRMVLIGRPAGLALDLYRAHPRRFVPFLGPYRDYRDKENWHQDPTLPARLREELQRGNYAGLGEFHLFAAQRHEPVFREIVMLAQNHRLPLMLHGDAEVVTQALDWAPGLTVIWAHLGTRPQPDAVRAILERYPQRLYVDTSVRDRRFVDDDGVLLAQWRVLFQDHADRIMAGIDTYDTNRWHRLDAVVADIRLWLDQLPAEAAVKIAGDNARRLFPCPSLEN